MKRCEKTGMRSLVTTSVLALMVAATYHPVVVQSQSTQPRRTTSINSSQARDWADRLTSSDAKVRTSAEASLIKGGAGSLPLLRRLLTTGDERLHDQTFEIIRQIGPPAIPLLVELLRHKQVEFRQFAADAFIDLTP